MGLFDFGRRDRTAGVGRGDAPDGVVEELAAWAATRVGIEGYVEPRTFVDEPTIVLVDVFGEWTRRRVGGDAGVRRIRDLLGIPVFDVTVTGYPQRKRDHDQRSRILADRARRERLRRLSEADREEATDPGQGPGRG